MNKMNYRKILLTSLITTALAGTSSVYAETDAEVVQIDDIIVTAKSNSTINDIAATVDVITSHDIQQSGASNLQDVLEDVAGFSFTINGSSTYGRKNIGLRGMDSAHILLLVNGQRTNATDGFIGHSNYQSSYFDINNIERIEVIKGAGSVLYGSEAIGGVINVITKAGAKESYTQATISKASATQRSGGDSSTISVGAGGKLDNFYGSFNFNHDGQDIVENKDGINTDFEEINNRNLSADLSYNFSTDTSINFGITDGHETRDLALPYYDIDRRKVSAGVDTRFADWDLTLNAYQTQTDAGYLSSGVRSYTHEIEDRVLNAEAQSAITNNQFLTIGLERHTTDYTQDYASAASSDYKAKGTTQNSVYLQDKISFNNNILTLGGRYDDNSQFGSGTSLSLGYVHSLSESLSLKASLGSAYKAPNIKEADSNYVLFHGTRVFQGNSNLDAETSNTAELALTGRNDISDWSVAVYHTKVKDMIVTYNTGTNYASTTNTLYTYNNINEAKVTGLELAYNLDLTDTLSLDTSFSRMNTDDGEGNDLPFRPEILAKVKLTKEFAYGFNLSLSGNHTGKSYNGLDNVDSYTLYDATLNKEVNKNVSLQLALNNLTGEQLDDVSGNHMTELLGREVKVTLQASF